MYSLVSRLGNSYRNTPRVRLQEYKTMYAFRFPFPLLRYFTGPAKSTPITLKGVVPLVLALGRNPGGGHFTATAWNFLHPQHFFGIFFASLHRRGTQYFSRTFTIVRPIPPCKVLTCSCCISLAVKRAESGKYIGYSPWICSQHSHIPSEFN